VGATVSAQLLRDRVNIIGNDDYNNICMVSHHMSSGTTLKMINNIGGSHTGLRTITKDL